MTCFVTNYCIYNYLLSYSLFAHANTTFELHTLQIYAKYLYVRSRTRRKYTIRLCKRLHDRHEDMFFRHGDMKTIFRQEDMKTCFLDKNLSFIGKKL